MRRMIVYAASALLVSWPVPFAQERPASGIGEAVRPGGAAGAIPPGLVEIEVQGEAPAEDKAVGAPSPLERPAPGVRAIELEHKIAQLFIITLNGLYTPNNVERTLLRDFPPGGVIIPAIARPIHAVEYVRALRGTWMEKEYGVPMLIGANINVLTQHRLNSDTGFGELPSSLSVGAGFAADVTRDLGRLIGGDMDAMGFNFHLGPALDLAPRLTGATGTTLCLGSDPALTAQAARALVEGITERGIVCAVTGFPGGGYDRIGDGPAVLTTPKSIVASRELVPYREAIAGGARIVHVGNTLVPTLDESGDPASLSEEVIGGVLRGVMAFDGLVIAGPMDAKDIAVKHKLTEAAVRSLRAGADMLYFMGSAEQAGRAIAGVAAVVRAGKLDEAVIDGAFERVKAFKALGELGARPLPEAARAEKIESDRQHVDIPIEVIRRSVTLAQNRGGVLPLTREANMPVGVTGVVGAQELRDALAKHFKDVAYQPIATAKYIGRVQEFEIKRVTKSFEGVNTVVCVFSAETAVREQAELARAIQAQGSRVVAVLVGYPNALKSFAEADAIVLAYDDAERIELTMRAVADVLAGDAPIAVLPGVQEVKHAANDPMTFSLKDVVRSPSGTLPITVEGAWRAGFGLSYEGLPSVAKTSWDFGDGSKSKDHDTTHAYIAAGRYAVALEVTDRQGKVSAGQFTVVVE